MKFISDENATRRHLAPKKNRCVWMEAGILSYLLCDREFDCDRCPLDEAMRSHFSGSGRKAQPEEPERASAATHRAGDGRDFYTADHLRVTLTGAASARLSIEPGLAKLLPTVRSVVLPQEGQVITPDAFCCWLVLEGGTLQLRLPVGGRVIAVNPALADQPHLLNSPGAGEQVWLFEFSPDDPEAFRPAFLRAGEAEAKYVRDVDNFHRLAAGCLHPGGSAAGLTLPDGGRFVDDLSTMIGPVKYLEIVRRAFGGDR